MKLFTLLCFQTYEIIKHFVLCFKFARSVTSCCIMKEDDMYALNTFKITHAFNSVSFCSINEEGLTTKFYLVCQCDRTFINSIRMKRQDFKNLWNKRGTIFWHSLNRLQSFFQHKFERYTLKVGWSPFFENPKIETVTKIKIEGSLKFMSNLIPTLVIRNSKIVI